MILLLARSAELEVRRDDDKCNSLRSTKNRFRLHCHPSFRLRVETRPILLEDHLYVLRLVRENPVSRWIFGKPDLLKSTCDRTCEVFTIFRRHNFLLAFLRSWISDASKISSSLSATVSPVPDAPSPHTTHILGRFLVGLSYQSGGVLTGLWQKEDDTQIIDPTGTEGPPNGSPRIRKVFSSAIRGLERFADNSNIPWNQPQAGVQQHCRFFLNQRALQVKPCQREAGHKRKTLNCGQCGVAHDQRERIAAATPQADSCQLETNPERTREEPR